MIFAGSIAERGERRAFGEPWALRSWTTGLLIALASSAVLAGRPAAGEATGCGLIDIGPTNTQPEFVPKRLNNDLMVAGFIRNLSPNPDQAAVWNGRRVIDLGALMPGGRSVANGINHRGVVVGESVTRNAEGRDIYRAFRWERGRLDILPTLGGHSASAWAINDSDQIAGWAGGAGIIDGLYANLPAPAVWQGGQPSALSAHYKTVGVGYAISQGGWIVGGAGVLSGPGEPTLWMGGTEITLKSLAPSPNSATALDVSDAGLIVGTGMNATQDDVIALVWQGLQVQPLSALIPGLPPRSVPAVNNGGAIVADRMLWSAGVARDINTLLSRRDRAAGWVFTSAVDINDRGDILGYARRGALPRVVVLRVACGPHRGEAERDEQEEREHRGPRVHRDTRHR